MVRGSATVLKSEHLNFQNSELTMIDMNFHFSMQLSSLPSQYLRTWRSLRSNKTPLERRPECFYEPVPLSFVLQTKCRLKYRCSVTLQASEGVQKCTGFYEFAFEWEVNKTKHWKTIPYQYYNYKKYHHRYVGRSKKGKEKEKEKRKTWFWWQIHEVFFFFQNPWFPVICNQKQKVTHKTAQFQVHTVIKNLVK